MMSGFKEFVLKVNVMDLAVGVLIGGAFGKIVDSVVGDLIMLMGVRFLATWTLPTNLPFWVTSPQEQP